MTAAHGLERVASDLHLTIAVRLHVPPVDDAADSLHGKHASVREGEASQIRRRTPHRRSGRPISRTACTVTARAVFREQLAALSDVARRLRRRTRLAARKLSGGHAGEEHEADETSANDVSASLDGSFH